MTHTMTAENLFQELERLPESERKKFFLILSEQAFQGEPDLSHETLFGHLVDTPFTAREAAEYLEVSMSTLRRHVASGRLKPGRAMGRNRLFAAPDLKRFKKALRQTKN